MSLEINLLIQKRTIPQDIQYAGKITRISAVIILALFIVISTGVIALRVYLNSQSQGIQNRTESAQKQIEELKSTESVYIALSQKVSGIDSILKNRFNSQDLLIKVKKNIPNDVSVSAISISPNIISFTAKVNSLDGMDALMNAFLNQSEIPIAEITLGSFAKSEGNNDYLLHLVIKLSTGQKVVKAT